MATAPRESHWDWVNDHVDILEVAQTFGIRGLKREGDHWQGLCPFHEDHHPSLTINPGTITSSGPHAGHWICWVCPGTTSDHLGGSAIDLVAQLQHLAPEQAMEMLYATYHGTAGPPPSPVPDPPSSSTDRVPAHWAAWYAAAWEIFSLAPEHRAALQARGLSPDAVDAWPWRSLPELGDPLRRGWQARLGALATPWPSSGVPGWTSDEGGLCVGPPGLLIPAWNRAGQISGAQIRPDGGTHGPKYLWWSSRQRGGGAGALSQPSWVWPRWSPPDWAHATELIFTEGLLKAILIAEWTGIPTVGVAGYTLWKHILPGLDAWPIPTITTAFDADVWTDPQKQRTEQVCWSTLEARYPTRSIQALRWDGHRAKGFDDVLAAGLAWAVVPIADLLTDSPRPVGSERRA